MDLHPQDWIPHRPPFLFVDEVLSLEERSLVARKTFDATLEVYRGHYPEHPVTPGALLCEAMFQAAGILVSYNHHKRNPSSEKGPSSENNLSSERNSSAGSSPDRPLLSRVDTPVLSHTDRPVFSRTDMPVLSRIEEARFHTPVFPNETVEMRLTWEETMGRFFCFRGLMSCRGKRVLSLRFILAHISLEEDSASAGWLSMPSASGPLRGPQGSNGDSHWSLAKPASKSPTGPGDPAPASPTSPEPTDPSQTAPASPLAQNQLA
jgi:3-hydroxyacyl-[acyl-carrier-protein] dehydratase